MSSWGYGFLDCSVQEVLGWQIPRLIRGLAGLVLEVAWGQVFV
jgi:hypothetical protein